MKFIKLKLAIRVSVFFYVSIIFSILPISAIGYVFIFLIPIFLVLINNYLDNLLNKLKIDNKYIYGLQITCLSVFFDFFIFYIFMVIYWYVKRNFNYEVIYENSQMFLLILTMKIIIWTIVYKLKKRKLLR